MTAFHFIPVTAGSSEARRVDFANLAGLFAEGEEPMRRSGNTRNVVRMAAAALLLLIAIGDTFLLTRPNTLPGCTLPRPAPARATF